MDFEKLSDRLKGFLQAAQTIAVRDGNPQITPEHLLKALLDDPEAKRWLADTGYDPAYGARPLRRLIQSAIGDPLSARVWPLGWGLTAALVSTMASNVFYLTMSFYYFYVIALLAIAAPAVFARRLHERPATKPR